MSLRIGRIIALLALLFAGSTAVEASSVLNFPRLAAEPGTLTGVALVNPSAELAQVSLTAYRSDGSVIGSAQLEIPAGRQTSFLTGDLFPQLDPGAVGWFQVTSETAGLTGFYLFLSLAGDQFDGADLPPPARRIFFPVVRIGEGYSTELNVVNPGPRSATVRMSLLGVPNPLASELQLEPRGVVRLDAADFFDTGELPNQGYLLAESSEDIVGFEFIRLGGQDLVGLNAKVAGELLNTLYFPQFAVSPSIRSELTLVNLSQGAASVEVAAHRPDGSLFSGVGENPRRLDLEPAQSRVEDLGELFGFEEATEGWLEVRTSTPAVNGSITYRVDGAGAAASVASVSRGSKRAIFSHIATTLGFFTGIAILNPGSAPADVSVVPLTAAGQSLGRVSVVLSPGERISRLVTDLLPSTAGRAGGFIFVASSRPVFLTSLFGTLEGSVLANIPPQPAPEQFTPVVNLGSGSVVPAWASLPLSGSRSFRAMGFPAGVNWRAVLPRGSFSAPGTIDAMGLYQAPMSVPSALPVTVTAAGSGLAASAVLDIVNAAMLADGQGEVQRLAFLPESQRLFAVLSFTPPAGNPAGPDESSTNAVYEIVPPDGRSLLADFGGERITSLLGMRSEVGEEFLLAAARGSGRLLRIDPNTGDTVELTGGLDEPLALALDPFTGNLLVAEREGISLFSRFQLVAGSSQPAVLGALPSGAQSLLAADEAGGVAVDRCTGNIFFSSPAAGQVLEYSRATGATRVVAGGLAGPGRILPLYRTGVGCPYGLHLMVVEEAGQGVALVIPGEGAVVRRWLADAGRDLVGLESASGVIDTLAVAGSPAGDGRVSSAAVPGLYLAAPLNPPQVSAAPASQAPGPDLEIESSVVEAGNPVTVQVRFRPGPPSQTGPPGALVFSIDYDSGRLGFDPSDANSDGIPDAVQSNLPADYFLGVSFEAGEETGRIGFVVADSEAPLGPILEGPILNVTFTALDTPGSSDIAFAMSSPVSLSGLDAELQTLDETLAGVVTVIR